MAVIFPRKTPCMLCDKPIQTGDDVVAFPAFLPSEHDLSLFSDAPFHRACFDADPRFAQMSELYGKYRAIWESRPIAPQENGGHRGVGPRGVQELPVTSLVTLGRPVGFDEEPGIEGSICVHSDHRRVRPNLDFHGRRSHLGGRSQRRWRTAISS